MKVDCQRKLKYASDGQTSAAVKIQSTWRSYRIRRHFLPHPLYFISKLYLDRCPNLADLPKASSGITKVYFPPELPVIFKKSGKQGSVERFFTMWSAREVCVKMGYKQLVIPKAHPYKEYNIEDKIPFKETKQKEQIGLYYENQQKFSRAVMEFTSLLCHSIYKDILTLTHPYQKEPAIPLGRYDNIPLFLDSSLGKIGLIDLQDFLPRKETLSKIDARTCALTAIYLFPYHFDEILIVMRQLFPQIVDDHALLHKVREEAVKRFDVIYAEHREFVKKKRITCENPGHFTPISFLRQTEIEQSIRFVVLKAIQDQPSLKDDLEQSYLWLDEEIIPDLVKTTIQRIMQLLTENAKPSCSYITLLSSRSLSFSFNDILSVFRKKQRLDVSSIFLSNRIEYVAQFLIKALLEEMENGQEICYANLYSNWAGDLLIRIHC